MNVVDANVLLYAVNTSAERHEQARGWLDEELGGGATVAFTWGVLLAFLRLSTKPGLFPRPLGVGPALDLVASWLGAPTSVVLEPTALHLSVLRSLLLGSGTGGNLTSDADLAALAVEHGATVVTYDNDFGRFPGVRWTSPVTPG